MHSYISTHERALYGICLSCKFSKLMAADFIGHLRRLEQNNGIKFVVSTLKDRYHAIVSRRFSTFTCRDGLWIGVWRNFHRHALRSRRHLKRALRILRAFGIFKHPEPTLSDYVSKKWELLDGKDLHKHEEVSDLFADHTRTIYFARRYSVQYPMSTKRAPYKEGRKLAEVLMSPREHIESTEEFPQFCLEFYPELSSLIGKDIPPKSFYLDKAGQRAFDVAGSVSLLTKDRGLKLRLVANCNRILQLCVSPLHNFLMKIMQTVPECFVFSQDRGAEWVSNRLSKGWSLTSLDLKSATDNIPLSNQLALLSQIAPEYRTELAMFHRIARMSWQTPHPFFLRWEVGHPMGVNASFGLFTVWLINLFYHIGAEGRFCIVGDDIVFDSYFESYIIARLAALNVPISRGKSLFSDSIFAEFVGRVLDKHGSLDVYKGAPYSVKDPLGIVRQYGRAAIEFLGPKRLFGNNTYKDVVETVSFFRESWALRESIKAYVTPFEVLKMEYHVPPPVYLGGVSRTVLHKMLDDLSDNPPISLESLSNVEKQFFLSVRWRVMGSYEPLRAAAELFHQVLRKQVETLPPATAYHFLLTVSDRVTRVAGFTVAFNDEMAVHLYEQLVDSLRRVRNMDDAADILVSYQQRLDLFSFDPISARNIAEVEKLALAKRLDPKDRGHKGSGKIHVSYVSVVYKMLRRAATRFLAVNK